MTQYLLTNDDPDYLIDGNIGGAFKYSNPGYNALSEIISVRGNEDYDEWIKNTILDPSGINIAASRSPRVATIDRVEWQEAQYHPNPYTGDPNDDYNLKVWAGAGGWVMSPLHLLKFMAKLDGFDLVNDILDDQRLGLLETPISVSNSFRYKEGGGWYASPRGSDNPIGREHGGAMPGTWTQMAVRDNGLAGAMFINYKTDKVVQTLTNILDNSDITWPCWRNNDIIDSFTTLSTENDEFTEEFGSELIINPREAFITENELRILSADIGDASEVGVDQVDFGFNSQDNDTSIQATFITPTQIRNPVAVVADFELCRSDTSLCNLDTIECFDGSLVGRDPNNDCEFYDCPDINLIGEILCASDRLQCDDGTIVRRNASLECAFNECPPCDDGDDAIIRDVGAGRRLLA